MNNPFAAVKAAARPYIPGASPEFAAHNNEVKAEALRQALKAGLLGLGGGAGLAALLGLPGLLKGQKIPSYHPPTDVDLPYPQPVGKSASAELLADIVGQPAANAALGAVLERRHAADPTEGALFGGARGAFQGMAAVPGGLAGRALASRLFGPKMLPGLAGAVAGGVLAGRAVRGPATWLAGGEPKKKDKAKVEKAEKKADVARGLVDALMPTRPGDKQPGFGSPRWFRGDTQSDAGAVPWGMPAAVLAGVGGTAGGAALVNYLLKKRRKSDLQGQLEAAQKEYDEALLAQYDPSKLRNLGAVKGAGALDACYAAVEKKALDLDDTAGRSAGVYLALASLLGLGSGIGTYKWLEGRGGEKTLSDALKRRALLRNLQSPPEMHVRPVPVEYTGEAPPA